MVLHVNKVLQDAVCQLDFKTELLLINSNEEHFQVALVINGAIVE